MWHIIISDAIIGIMLRDILVSTAKEKHAKKAIVKSFSINRSRSLNLSSMANAKHHARGDL